jgi:hypothetical protein
MFNMTYSGGVSKMSKKIFSMSVFAVLFFAAVPFVYAAGVDLAWDAPTDGGTVEGYRIYWKTADGSYNDTNSKSVVGKTSETVSSLDETKTYNFIVKAYNAAGVSPSSNEVEWSYSDATPPLQVQGVSAN